MSSPESRPTFLTILCFLTFMSAVTGLWSQSERLWNPAITAENTRRTFEEVKAKIHSNSSNTDTEAMDKMFDAVMEQTTADTIRTGAIIMLIFESLCLYAAYLMWNLQKKGFFLYLGGVAVAFLAPLFLIGGWLGVITAMAATIFSFVMLIFYAFNLKYMQA